MEVYFLIMQLQRPTYSFKLPLFLPGAKKISLMVFANNIKRLAFQTLGFRLFEKFYIFKERVEDQNSLVK